MTTVELPLWLVTLMGLGCTYAVLVSLLIPGTRWYVRSRLLRTVERVNRGLQIKIRPFQRTRRQVLIDRLAWDREVLDTIERVASETNTPREVLQSRVHVYASEIVPAFNVFVYFRLGYRLARWVSRFIYRVHVAAVDYDRLDEVDPEATVVFVMNHRSNMDYLLVTYLVAKKVSLSYAVGEWARFFPLRGLVKALGGFFVRRNSNDALYRKVLERYVDMSTREGVCQAVYLEGGLTRDGSLGKPKLGFIDYMLRDFDTTRDRDIVFVPVAINYDHVLEDDNMLGWDDPERPRGRFRAFVQVVGFLKRNLFADGPRKLATYGYAGVNFGVPVSARAWVQAKGVEFGQLPRDERFALVGDLADDLMAAIASVMPVLPVPLISYVFEHSDGKPLTPADVVSRASAFLDRVIDAGGAIQAREKPKLVTISNALKMMVNRHFLTQEGEDYVGQSDGRGLKLRRYYANSIARIAPQPGTGSE